MHRSRRGEVFPLQRAVCDIDLADFGGPEIGAVDERGEGIGGGAHENENAARGIGDVCRGFRHLDEVNDVLLAALDLQTAPVDCDLADFGGAGGGVSGDVGDGENVEFEQMFGDAFFGNLEGAKGERCVGDGCRVIGARQSNLVSRTNIDNAIFDFESEQVLEQRGVLFDGQAFEGEFPGGSERFERKLAAPGEFLAAVGRAGKGVGIFIVRIGVEMGECNLQRADEPPEGSARRQIGKGSARAPDLEEVDVNEKRFGGFGRFRRVLGEFGDEVGEVEGVIFIDLDADVGLRRVDLFEYPRLSEERG